MHASCPMINLNVPSSLSHTFFPSLPFLSFSPPISLIPFFSPSLSTHLCFSSQQLSLAWRYNNMMLPFRTLTNFLTILVPCYYFSVSISFSLLPVDHWNCLASHVAPALQSKEAELKRSQLEDVLNHKIQERPTPETLVEKHILGAS